MKKYQITIGLLDKDSEKQEITTESAKEKISKILINQFKIPAYTMIECYGVYKMKKTNKIIFENSLRIEIATENDFELINTIDEYGNKSNFINAIVQKLKLSFNQESIMLEISENNISFIE